MHVTIATCPCSWGVFWPDGSPSGTPYETFLSQASEAGYIALELGPLGYLPTDPGRLKAELDKYKLALYSGTCVYKFDKFEGFSDFRDKVDELCRLLSKFGAKYIVVMDESDVGRFSEKKKDWPFSSRIKYIGLVKEMADFTFGQYGIKTVYHPHVRSMIEFENEIIGLLEETNVDLCFDTGHHAYANGGVEKGDRCVLNFLEKYAERIPYLHFKNVNSDVLKKVRKEGLDNREAGKLDVMCDLELGLIDFVELKSVLEKIGYNGIGVIEQDMPRATADFAFTASKRNLQYLRKIGIID